MWPGTLQGKQELSLAVGAGRDERTAWEGGVTEGLPRELGLIAGLGMAPVAKQGEERATSPRRR